jgi:translation initiation factor 2B subunit (eIF-2B alpha/beta/delta family)
MDFFKLIKDSLNVDRIMAPVNNIAQAANTLESLVSLINDSKVSASARNMLQGLKLLLQSRPNITSINHYINHFLLKLDPENQPIVVKELLEVFHDRWKNVDRKTAEVALKEFDYEQKTIVLHGADPTVQTLIETLAVKQYKIKVIQTFGRPFGHGMEQAREISRHEYNLRFIEDTAISSYLEEADALLIGADVIMHETFTAAFGTHSLAMLFYLSGKPVFVLADSRHILNKKFFSKVVTDTITGTGKKQTVPLWKDAPDGIAVEDIAELEEIPNSLVTKFILENEAFTPEELSNQIDKVLVFKFF